MPLVPLKDNLGADPRSWVTISLIVGLVLAAVLPIPADVAAAVGHGSRVHLCLNVLALWLFGPSVEGAFGHARFLALTLTAGAVAYVAGSVITNGEADLFLATTATTASVTGVYLACFLRARIITLVPVLVVFSVIEVPARRVAAAWVLGTVAVTATGHGLWGPGEPTMVALIPAVVALISACTVPRERVRGFVVPPRRP